MSTPPTDGCAPCVSLRELHEAYLAQRRRPVGASDRDNIKLVFAFIITLFPNATTADFDAEKLEALINFLIRQKSRFRKPYSRKYINKLVGFVRSVFRWGATKKLVSYKIVAELALVPALQYGEALHENDEREDASPEAIIATIRHLKEPQFIDMVILQVLTGMRPSELCNLKAGEIKKCFCRKTGKNVWTFVPYHHKTKWKGKKRSITLGDEEMTILQKYMTDKNADDFLFCNLRRYKNKAITTQTYSSTIKKTQEEHDLEKFTPYQIRHANGTWVSTILDRDHARAQLGHTTEKTTGIYDHADAAKQEAVIEKRKAVGSLIGDVFDYIDVPTKPTTEPSYPHIIKFPSNSL